MKTIQTEEIESLYKICGLNERSLYGIRTTINSGMLDNKLNSNFEFLEKNTVGSIWTNSAVEEK
jgi:hypothetical protein